MVAHRKTETAQGFGTMLRQARERVNLSQKALGERLGVKQSQVSNVEAGVDMRLSTLANFARYLGYEMLLVPRERVRDAIAVSTAATFTPSGPPSGLYYVTMGATGPLTNPPFADEPTHGSVMPSEGQRVPDADGVVRQRLYSTNLHVISARRPMFATGGVIDDDDDGEREG